MPDDRQAGGGKAASAAMPDGGQVRPRRVALLLVSDQEFREQVARRAGGVGLATVLAGSVAQAIGGWTEDIGIILLDAALSGEAGPLMAKALENGTPVIVAGTPAQGGEALRLIEAGAWGYFPLPQAAKAIAEQLRSALANEEERHVDLRLVEHIKAELQAVFDTFPSALVVVGPDMRIRRANRAALMLSRKASFLELKGLDFCDTFGCGGRESCPVADAVRSGREAEHEFEAPHTSGPSGAPMLLHCKAFANGGPARADDRLGDGKLMLVEDATLRKLQETEHGRAKQLEAVALLAATLSHEINQPLGTILGRAQLALLALDQKEADLGSVRRDLAEIEDAVRRVNDILGKLHRVGDIVTKPYVGGAKILDLDRSARG